MKNFYDLSGLPTCRPESRLNQFAAVVAGLFLAWCVTAQAQSAAARKVDSLNGPDWQFIGTPDAATPAEIGSDAFRQAAWTPVAVPHNFQTRAAYDDLTRGWYRRRITVDPAATDREFYLIFEGAATIADVYVNGQHLGQHRGAYTRFVFDATKALHPGADNELAVLVNDSPADTKDCLPWSETGLYKIWGGLYRNVWLVSTAPAHIDPTDDGGPGVYLTPSHVSAESAGLNIRTLLRNCSSNEVRGEVRSQILDPDGKEIKVLTAPARVPANGTASVELNAAIDHPRLWESLKAQLYQVKTGLYVNGRLIDEVTQATGFRWLEWDWAKGNVKLNGKRIILYGANLHQEIESKGSAVSEDDLRANFAYINDLGLNFMRFPHYPHAQIEYDLCDQNGILAWAENGHSNGRDIVGPTAARITAEMVKQNYNHPSIIVWSMGNESNAEVADQCVPVAKALDATRPVGVANQKSNLADFHTSHRYYGWYHADLDSFKPDGFVSEVGVGGVVTTHCDYADCDWDVNKYEPEEYQQIVSEHNFQQVFHGDNSRLGMFCVWCLREFSDAKYKKPVGINSKGLITYAGSKKDVYYLYRSFLRPTEPTVWIASKRYFLRLGAVDNGIKVYSNAANLTLTLNGQKVSTLTNGQYTIPSGPWTLHVDKKKSKPGEPAAPGPTPRVYTPEKADNVFFWPVPLRMGKNIVTASDDRGHSDTATIYFYGEKGLPALPAAPLPIRDLASTNAANPARYIDMPVQAEWPVYTDFDSTADNSWNAVPPELENASWIALRRVTKSGQATDVSFTVAKPAKVYVVATKGDTLPAFATSGQFQLVAEENLRWRDNALQLVPVQIFVRLAAAGERMNLSLGDRDALVAVKGD